MHFLCLTLTEVENLRILPYMEKVENRKTHIPQIFEIRQYDQWTPKI